MARRAVQHGRIKRPEVVQDLGRRSMNREGGTASQIHPRSTGSVFLEDGDAVPGTETTCDAGSELQDVIPHNPRPGVEVRDGGHSRGALKSGTDSWLLADIHRPAVAPDSVAVDARSLVPGRDPPRSRGLDWRSLLHQTWTHRRGFAPPSAGRWTAVSSSGEHRGSRAVATADR